MLLLPSEGEDDPNPRMFFFSRQVHSCTYMATWLWSLCCAGRHTVPAHGTGQPAAVAHLLFLAFLVSLARCENSAHVCLALLARPRLQSCWIARIGSRPANHAPWTRPRRGIPAWSPPRALRSCAPPALAVRTGAAQLIQARPRPPRVEAAAVAALQVGRRQAAGPAFINRSADCRRIRSRGTPP